MAILLDDRPQVEVEELSTTGKTTTVVDREELVAQGYGLTKPIVRQVWKVLEEDVRRETEAALRIKYSLLLAAWVVLAFSVSAFQPLIGTAGLLAAVAALVGLRIYCAKVHYDVSWERKVFYVYSVWMALAHPKSGGEVTLHQQLVQSIMLVAHQPAREELARRGLRIAINDDGFCGQTVRAEMAKDLVTAFGATPIVGDLTIHS